MLKNLISQADMLIWPKLSLIILVGVFVSICIWVLRKKQSQHYDDMAHMVLDEEKEKSGEEPWKTKKP